MTSRTTAVWTAACLVNGELEIDPAKDVAAAEKTRSGAVRWAGFDQGFFLTALSPRPDADERFTCSARTARGDTRVPDGTMEMLLGYSHITIKDGDPPFVRTMTAYYGPKYLEPDTEAKLERATESALRLASENGITQIALPPIGTGLYQVPLDVCARVMLKTVEKHLAGETSLKDVAFVGLDSRELAPMEAQIKGGV